MKRFLRFFVCVALVAAALIASYATTAKAGSNSQESLPATGDCPHEC